MFTVPNMSYCVICFLVAKRTTIEISCFKVSKNKKVSNNDLYDQLITLQTCLCVCLGQGIDTLLSDTGHQQAAAAGVYLKDLHFTNVFVSNLQRAIQVCQSIKFFCV